MGAPGLLRTGACQFRERLAVESHREVRPAHRAVAGDPEVRPRDNCKLVEKAAPSRKPRSEVVLLADTWNNYFRPRVSQAAYEVLRHAGFAMHVPQAKGPSLLRATAL
jgi:Fe-S oxidoreductase